jgi:hypothetical protein
MPINVQQYFLSKTSFVCSSEEYWIILNAEDDQYSCVSRTDIASVSPWIHGLARECSLPDDLRSHPKAYQLIDALLANGVLTPKQDNGKPFAVSEIESPLAELLASPTNKLGIRAAKHLPMFLVSCNRMDRALRKQPLIDTLQRSQARRIRHNAQLPPFEFNSARLLIESFYQLRPLYPRPYLCLFDSLALLEFLACQGHFPRLIFGVRADPFSAHCWIQAGNVVLNDNLERVRAHTPIMSN